jgi:hypothetical protein
VEFHPPSFRKEGSQKGLLFLCLKSWQLGSLNHTSYLSDRQYSTMLSENVNTQNKIQAPNAHAAKDKAPVAAHVTKSNAVNLTGTQMLLILDLPMAL